MFIGSHHRLSITGRIIKDIELFTNANDIPLVKLAIPTNYTAGRDTEGNVIVDTTWFQVTIRAEAALAAHKTLKRGDHIQVIGRLLPEVRVREMKNGRVVGEYEVLADEVIFLQGGFKDDRQ